MTLRGDIEAEFRSQRGDPYQWLFQAEALKEAAAVILPALKAMRDTSQTVPGAREKYVGYFQAYMLLIGLAFENLLKGIVVGKHSECDPATYGHQLVKMADENVPGEVPEGSDEYFLLQRLEVFVLWAGRYLIPRNAGRYLDDRLLSLRSGGDDDFPLADSLFSRLKHVLVETAKGRKGYV